MTEEQIQDAVADAANNNDGLDVLGSKTNDAEDPEAAMESARAQAEARRRRILEKANNRMKYVNGEQAQDEEEKKMSLSNAARIRAARQRRYGKKSSSATGTTVSTRSATPATTSKPTTAGPVAEKESEITSNPENESDGQKKNIPTATTETTSFPAAEVVLTSVTGSTTKKKYVGVARMRRKMLVKKKLEEENNDSSAGSADDSNTAKAFIASNGKSSKRSATVSTSSVGKVELAQIKVQRIPIYMHITVIILLFLAGFDVGIQQYHVDVDIRSKVAVQEYGVPFVQRIPWNPLKLTSENDSKDILEGKFSPISSSSGTEDSRDEFDEEIDQEYIPPNIDPIFRVDLDRLTKGPGLLNRIARGAIAIHRLMLWIIYYGPMGFFVSILSIPTAFIESPPGLFLAAVILRQVVGKGVLGADIPEDSGDEGSDGTKQKSIEVLSMAKNFVKNFFNTTFPTLVTLYDAYLHLKADMYIVLCGVFFGLAWTHLNFNAFSYESDSVFGFSEKPSEGEL